jgi:hypothetical protein
MDSNLLLLKLDRHIQKPWDRWNDNSLQTKAHKLNLVFPSQIKYKKALTTTGSPKPTNLHRYSLIKNQPHPPPLQKRKEMYV